MWDFINKLNGFSQKNKNSVRIFQTDLNEQAATTERIKFLVSNTFGYINLSSAAAVPKINLFGTTSSDIGSPLIIYS